MVVRNGARTLADCLRSVTPLVDEMIVIDTGSDDDSAAIARSFGADVFDISWNNDFAAARNEYLKIAHGNWIFSLDSDEVLGEVEQRSWKAMLSNPPGAAYVFTIRNYFLRGETCVAEAPRADDGLLAGVNYFRSRTVRLFPRRTGIEYRYPVHESLIPALRHAKISLRHATTLIHHLGYLYGRDEWESKVMTYRMLAQEKLEAYPGDFIGYVEMGKLLLHANELDEALPFFLQGLRLDPRQPKIYYYLALTLWRQRRFREANQQCRRALAIFPHNPNLLRLAHALKERRD